MLLNVLANTVTITLSETALYALIGVLIVFIGILFLILVVSIIGKVFSLKNQQKPTPKVEKEKTVPLLPQNKEDEIPEEVVAVIMASIMAYYQNENGTRCEFKVKRIKRI